MPYHIVEARLDENHGVDGIVCLFVFVSIPIYLLQYLTNFVEVRFYPRLILLVPQVVMIGIILATYPTSSSPPKSFILHRG